MKRFEGMILCSDVDGTLIDEKNNVPKENIEAIAYFQAHGGKFTLATGRSPDAVTPILGGIHLDLPGICHNGCSIYDYNKETYVATTELSRSAEIPTREMMKLFPDSGVEIITDEGIFVLRPNFATERHISFERVNSTPADSFDAVTAKWFKILFAHDPDDITMIQETMEPSPYRNEFSMIRTHQYYYEIYNKNACKGNAVKQLFKLYDIAPESFYAIGDNDNDVEMLELAGVGAAVANATPSAKAAANNVMTKTNEQGGVAEFIASL